MEPKIGLVQMGCGMAKAANVTRAIQLTHQAADQGAQIVCHQELLSTIYFCVERNEVYKEWAEPIPGPTTNAFAQVAKERKIAIIVPIFEVTPGGIYYNTAGVLGPDGSLVGIYRKMSIPRAANADEKYYFAPGDIGYRVFDIAGLPRFGILICYDRHFPEGARALALQGAQIIFIPAATPMHSRHLWELELRGIAAANLCYVAGINRVGYGAAPHGQIHYYGSSLVINPRGESIIQASSDQDEVITADLDLEVVSQERNFWRFFEEIRTDALAILTDRSTWALEAKDKERTNVIPNATGSENKSLRAK